MQQDSELEQEWLRQNNIIYGALIAVGVFMAQPFLTATSLDLTAKICIVAFAVAIPLLAALMLINRQEAFRHRRSRSTLVAIIGVDAGFWHLLGIAGVAVLASGLIGVLVHSAGYWRLERDRPPAR